MADSSCRRSSGVSVDPVFSLFCSDSIVLSAIIVASSSFHSFLFAIIVASSSFSCESKYSVYDSLSALVFNPFTNTFCSSLLFPVNH